MQVSPEDLVALLHSAHDRDAVVEALFGYAKQFFDYTALFVVRGETAGGRLAFGEGTSETSVRQLAVPLEIPSLFQEAASEGRLMEGTLGATRLGRIIGIDLNREPNIPSVVAPVVLKKRAVLLLYGDLDGASIKEDELGGLRDALVHASNAFKRLIVTARSDAKTPEESEKAHSTTVPFGKAIKPMSARAVLGVPREAPPPPLTETLQPSARVVEPEQKPGREPSTTVIVNMGADIESLVDNLLNCVQGEEGEAVQTLLDAGEPVLPVLVQRFPGPLWVDKKEVRTDLRGRDVSGIARALVAFGDRAVPYICTLLENAKPERRYFAVALGAEFQQPQVLRAITHHLYDDDPEVRRLTVSVLRGSWSNQKAISEALKPVRNEALHLRKNAQRRILAITALGSLGDVRSIQPLIGLINSESQDVSREAYQALVAITGQDFARSAKRWTSWLERNAHRHRLEWLMDALLHSSAQIRASAGDELQEITQQYFGFAALSSRRDREVARKKYQDWWEQEGRAEFAGEE